MVESIGGVHICDVGAQLILSIKNWNETELVRLVETPH
jgi:hypothetical protein